MSNIIIFTDLDGTLLHPSTYSFEEALPALELLREKDIPLVLCSSKTRAELAFYRERLSNRHPFIVENGGGICIPEGYFPFRVDGELHNGYRLISLGMPYQVIRRKFIELRNALGTAAAGFGDMSPKGVAALTGLTEDEAVPAMAREYSEPFVFAGAADERFLQAVEGAGLRWTQGRLFHIMGDHHKGRAVCMLKALYERQYGSVTTIGLGDSLNDLPFLLAVDRPVLVRKEDGSHDPRINLRGLYRTDKIGPAGWNEAVLKLLAGDASVRLQGSGPHR
jgi:mannosyl-3-phosphoglycerate phosphatase family protein